MTRTTEKQRDFLRLFDGNGYLCTLHVDPYRYSALTLNSLVARGWAKETGNLSGVYRLTSEGEKLAASLPGTCEAQGQMQMEGCDQAFPVDCDREAGHKKDHFNWQNHYRWNDDKQAADTTDRAATAKR